MSFDSLTMRSVIAQLNKTIIAGEIINIVQSSPLDITLRISTQEKIYNLFFSIHPVYARAHLISVCPKRAKRWHFADFLQNHIGDGKIAAIEQINFDRIIRIRIIPRTEIINPVPKILTGEFMGKHSNLIILEEDTNRILESMKHIDETISRYRQVLPGLSYVMPPVSQTIDPFSADGKTLSAILAAGEGPFWKKIVKTFQGMSPLLAKEIIARSTDTSPEAVQNAFLCLMTDIQNEKLYPTVITRDNDNDVMAVSAINLRQFQDSHATGFPAISDALEFFYQRLIAKDSFLAEKAAILQTIKREYETVQAKHETLRKQLETAENADNLKLNGDLLIANLYNFQKGQKEVKLQNIYDPHGAEIIVQLDEKLSPSDNAQRYFEEYKRAKRSRNVLIRLVSKNQTKMEHLKKLMEEAEKAGDMEALSIIRSDLTRRGIIKEKSDNKRKRKEEAPQFKRFTSSDGLQIYMGRNDRENDLLIKRESSKNDMWLHAKQVEGSHVIIRNPERRPDIPKRTLLEAAIIAASFSKAKHSGIVPVDYTWIKYVNKPRGAKPGFVTYTHEKTLFVSPSDFDKLFAAPQDQIS